MKRLLQKLAGCIVLAIILLPTYGQTPIDVGRKFRDVVLDKQVQLLEDASKRLTFQEVIHKPFQSQSGPSINPGFSNSFYWVRFRLHNPDSTPKQLLLEVENPHINKLRLYTLGQGHLKTSMLTGDHFPFYQRPIQHPHFLFPITVNAGQTITCYLWVDKHGEQVQIPLQLWDKAYFGASDYKLYLFVGFMLGIGGLYCAVSLLTLLFFRLRVTVYYFFFTIWVWLFLTAHTGFGFAFLWPYATWWTSAARPSCAMLIYISSLLFVRSFFHLRESHPFLHRYTQALIWMLVICLLVFWSHNPALGLFNDYWYNPVYYSGEWLLRYMIIMHIIIFISLASVSFTGLIVYRKNRQPEGLWVAIGFLMTLLSGSSITLVHAGFLPDNYITHNLPLVANSLDTVVLSFLLANRFKNIYMDNAQISIELADQRQRNAIQLLEGQIIERRRLSQELHDGISLALGTIRLRLSLLAEKLNGQQSEAEQLVEALGDVGQDVRQFSHALSPVLLERYGLVGALEELIDEIRDSHPSLVLQFDAYGVVADHLQPLITQTVYQITLELLNNATRYAQAQQIDVYLNQFSHTLRLVVSDNGQGYDYQEITAGIGLQNIQARVQLLNGQFSVNRLAKGMKHIVEIPVQTRLFS
ncbi:sensor histidine kinase [Spirosoma gilvum]